jgi:ribonuclease HI
MAGDYPGKLLVFTDASKKHQAAVAAVLFPDQAGEPVVAMQQMAMIGSNELEFQAVLYGLLQAQLSFPDRPLALFSDNQDAIARICRAKALGLEQDPALSGTALSGVFPALKTEQALSVALSVALTLASFHWVKAHHYCRGNRLADEYAGQLARQ